MISLTVGDIISLCIVVILIVLLPFIIISIQKITKQITKTNQSVNVLIHHLDDTTQMTTRLLEDVHDDNQQIQPSLKAIGTIGTNIEKLNNTLKKKHHQICRWWKNLRNK